MRPGEWKGERRVALLAVVVAGAGWTAIASAGLLAGPTRVPIAREHRHESRKVEHRPGELCAGGEASLARIEVVPEAVVRQAGRERVEYHSEIALHRGKKVGVAWKADVINDRGVVVVPNVDVGAFKGKSGDVAVSKTLRADLNDGFYSLRVRAAVTAEGEVPDVLESAQHLEVKGGRWTELTDSEWTERSNEAQAFSAAELSARGMR
jgi:hypothetical protein